MGIEDKVRKVISEALSNEGFKLIKVEYVKEKENFFLRIVIDRDEPVNIDQCMVATKIINTILDKEDILEHKYILDVCSNERGCN